MPRAIRGHLGLAGQFASVDELLTGRENLELIGRLYGIAATDCHKRVDTLLMSLGLDRAADRRVGTYSGGMRRRLDLITSQNLDEVEQLADRVVVIDDGTVIADDHVNALRNRIGGQVIDVAVDAHQLDTTASALRSAGFDTRQDHNRRRVVATTTSGLSATIEAAVALADTDPPPSEFALRTRASKKHSSPSPTRPLMRATTARPTSLAIGRCRTGCARP